MIAGCYQALDLSESLQQFQLRCPLLVRASDERL